MVLLHLQYDIYHSPVPTAFVRSAPSINLDSVVITPLPLRAISTFKLTDCMTVILTSEIGRGATGVTHRGTLEVEYSDEFVPLDVVVKLAFHNEQKDALRNEYEVYRCLRLEGILRGVTTVLGFFTDSEGGPCALVMLYAGVSLDTQLERSLSISDQYVDAFPQFIRY